MKKKLIEVALPLDAINKACAREKSIRHSHTSTLHLWWARRPLAAARAVKSPNLAFAEVEVPLASTFMLSTKAGMEAYVEPVIEGSTYRFMVKVGKPKDTEAVKKGTKLSQGSFRCLMSNTPFRYSYIDDEANAWRMGVRLMAVVAEGDRGRAYLSPSQEVDDIAKLPQPTWKPDAPRVVCRADRQFYPLRRDQKTQKILSR
ncbi:MAG: DUF1156 domain-containing protein [Desulfobulbaceae bacterium]|nr:MAG: DUF1156 domain-containing protein [Desulfobulbaceae bacterium]